VPRIVGGTQESPFGGDVELGLFLIPDMVTRGQKIDTDPKELLRHRRGDAEAACRILGILAMVRKVPYFL
jgi:hypothetical protein